MGRERLCCFVRRCGFFLAFLEMALVAGCNRISGNNDDGLLKHVRPLETSALMPFDIEEFRVSEADAAGATDQVFDLELRGKFQQTLYAFVDIGVLSAGFANSPQAELEKLRTAMPGKHAELEKKFQQLVPGGGYYVLLCKQGEPCEMSGEARATKSAGEWKLTSISMTTSGGTRGAGLRYVTVDGTWGNNVRFASKDLDQSLRGRLYMELMPKRETLVTKLPPGVAATDIDSPAFNGRATAVQKLLGELHEASHHVRETTGKAGGEMYRSLQEVADGTWTFEADTPSGKRKLQLEAKNWRSDNGESALFDVASPMRRQRYQLKFVRESGVRVNVGGVMVERMCWEGRASGDQPDALLGTERGDVDHRDRPAAYRLFAEKEGYSIEFGGKSFPLTAAKSRDMLKRLNGVHPTVQPIKVNSVWTGTVIDEAGKSRPVKAHLLQGYNGIEQTTRLEFSSDVSVPLVLFYINTEANGWYANGVLPHDVKLPANAAAGDLEHLKRGLRFEVPEKDRWVGYSRDGKYTYEFTVR